MDKNPAQFLDKILTFLSADYNKIFSIQDVINEVYKKELIKESKFDSVDTYINGNNHFETSVINSIMFLNREGLVAYNSTQKTVFINTAGYIKINTIGFQKQINDAKLNLRLQRVFWIIVPISSLISLSILLYNFFCHKP